MGEVVDAVPRFARRTAEAAIDKWDRAATVACMKRMGPEYEKEVVKQIEKIVMERNTQPPSPE